MRELPMLNKIFENLRIGLLSVVLLFVPGLINAQDLGSSTDLFKNNPSPKKSKTPKKTPPVNKRTPVVRNDTKKKSASKINRATSAKNRRSTESVGDNTIRDKNSNKNTRNALNKRTPDNTVVINVGDASNGEYSEVFEKAITAGNTARNQREYIKSEDAYSRAKSLNSNDSRAIYGLGNIYSDQQRWEEAENAYRQAIKLEPDNPAAYVAISFVLTQPVVGSSLGGRYLEAEKMARRAIELDAANAVGYDQLGVALELQGSIEMKTNDAYRKAIELEPNFALAYAHLGRLLRRQGKTKESSEFYRQSLILAKDVPTMIMVADVLQSQQRYLESEQLLRAALRQDEKNPTGLYLLGRALIIRKKFDEAELILKKSVEISPNSFVSYTLLGSLYYISGDLNLAEKTLEKALKVISVTEKKRLSQEFEEVGDRYFKVDKYEDALRVYKRADDLDKSKKSLVFKMSQAKNKL